MADGATVSPVPGLELALRSPGCLWTSRGWRMSKGGPGGGGEVSSTEGWSFRGQVPAGDREVLLSCSKSVASSHKSPFLPKPLGTLRWEGGGPLAAPPGDVAGIEVRDLSRVPRKC